MNTDQYKRVKEIFLAACDQPAERRAEFVKSASEGDDELRREVEGLLKEHQREAQLMPSEPEGPIGSMSALLTRAALESSPGNGSNKDASNKYAEDPTHELESTPPSRYNDDAHDQTSGSHSGIVDAGRFMAGTVVAGRYRIIEMLGRGGMGEVYRADDITLNQSVALKFLPTLFGQDQRWLERFRNEVRLARQVTHPNVCRVFDIGEFQGEQFISMEYVDGENLASLLRRIGRVPHDKALLLARQLCAGLGAAHDRGVLHRDLKPANVMIDGRGAVRITDFGLAAPADQMRGAAGGPIRAGTPAYMSPEQLAGKPVTVRSDVYSLGLVLYEMFTGRRAFRADSFRGYQKAHSSEEPTPPSEIIDDIDPIVDRAIMRCLSKDPKDRPASAMAVSAALPGGNPLREILATGETPSPEVVAAAGEAQGSMKPRLAIALLVTALLCLIGFIFMAPDVFVVQKALSAVEAASNAHAQPPDILAFKAQEILKDLGYTTPPRDSAQGFDVDRSYYLHIEEDYKMKGRLWRLWRPRLGMVYFWYRQSPDLLVPLRPEGSVVERDPSPGLPGMIRVRLDLMGRLMGLEVEPQTPTHSMIEALARATSSSPAPAATLPAASAASSAPATIPAFGNTDWGPLLAAAGVDISKGKFHEVATLGSPSVYADERIAWEGAFDSLPSELVHLEAAALHGKPVYFAVIGNWNEERFSEDRAQVLSVGKSNLLIQTLVTAALVAAGSVLAMRNYRSGRGDRKGAARMALAFFLLGAIAWLLGAHHLSDPVYEFMIFRRGMGAVMYLVSLMWIFYMALEPYVRRVWPETVISWNRLLAGRWIDPLVGRDVLAGAAVGVMTTLLSMIEYQIPQWIESQQLMPVPLPSIMSVTAMLDAVHGFSGLFNAAIVALYAGLVLLLFLVIMRMATRRWWLAAGTSVLIFALATTHYSVEESWWRFHAENWLSLGIQILLALALLIVLTRHGLVALIFCLLVRSLLMDFPVTWHLDVWFARASLTGIVPCLIILGVAFYATLGGKLLPRLRAEE